MKPNDHGFTLIEIVIVMVLISIVAATIFTRSITSDELNLISRSEKIQSHIRYAQSLAIKNNDVWGIECVNNKYSLFNKTFSQKAKLPGENSEEIDLDDSGLIIHQFSLFFDYLGKPYIAYNNPDSNFPVNSTVEGAMDALIIRIELAEDTSIKRKLSITPETGLIVDIQ